MPNGTIVETMMVGDISLPPDGIIDFVQPPPPPYGSPMRDGRLESESVDQNWAAPMQATLWNIAGAVGDVRGVECRTTFCVIDLEHIADVRTMDLQTRRTYIRSQIDFLDEMMRAVTAGSGGRLAYHGYTTVGTPDENFALQLYVYGPPLEDRTAPD